MVDSHAGRFGCPEPKLKGIGPDKRIRASIWLLDGVARGAEPGKEGWASC